jgi:hypothetical protein
VVDISLTSLCRGNSRVFPVSSAHSLSPEHNLCLRLAAFRSCELSFGWL